MILRRSSLKTSCPLTEAFVDSLKSETAGQNSDLRLAKDTAVGALPFPRARASAKGNRGRRSHRCPEYVSSRRRERLQAWTRRDGQVASPTDIYEITVMTDYEDAEGTSYHAEKEVTIQTRDGSVRDMKAVLRTVLGMWITEFKSRGLLGHLGLPKPEAHVIPTRASASGAALIDLTPLQGVRFNYSVRRQRFDCSDWDDRADRHHRPHVPVLGLRARCGGHRHDERGDGPEESRGRWNSRMRKPCNIGS